jgi:hypothetical protein
VTARWRSPRLGFLVVGLSALLLCGTPTSLAVTGAVPARLDDRTFWRLINDFSEPDGFFRSDNLVSNEITFQYILPTLQAEARPAGAYLGVGPEQNFTYIATLRPRIAFIVDIRRENMLLHLLYKGLMEASPTRLDFLSHLFSRQPHPVAPGASVEALFEAFSDVQPDQAVFRANRETLQDRLMHQHHFQLSHDDWAAIDYVYGAFMSAGPDLRYSFGRGSGWFPFPSYRELMVQTDNQGRHRSYLASEDSYQVVRQLELKNLLVPVVGDFGGPKALRSVGAWLHTHGLTVSAFYTSNVEQYLFHGDDWQRFYANASVLPLDTRSVFIRAVFENAFGYRGFRVIPIPDPSMPTSPIQPVPPRSITMLSSIQDTVAAARNGRIESYRDVVGLSK